MRRICPRCQKRYGDDVLLCPHDSSPLRADPLDIDQLQGLINR